MNAGDIEEVDSSDESGPEGGGTREKKETRAGQTGTIQIPKPDERSLKAQPRDGER